MNDQFENDLPQNHRPEKQGMGCLFWGCLITAVVLVTLVAAIIWWLYSTYSGFVNQYTSTEPMALEVVELPEDEMTALNDRFTAFQEAVKAGENPGDLELSAEELNALIGQDPDLAGRALVRIEQGQLGGDISIPTDFLPLAGNGRFLNATGKFDASMENGVLVVTLASATVNDAEVPEEVITAMKSNNLAQGLYDNADTAKTLRQFESLTIEGDKVVLKARPASETEADPDPSADADSADADSTADPASGDSQESETDPSESPTGDTQPGESAPAGSP